MAAYPDGLPTRVDGSLGRTKTNARAVEDLDYEVPAEEFNILADSVEGIAATLGLPNAVGMPAALASLISAGKVFALQQISTNGVLIAESTTLVEILAIDLYVATSAQTAPSWRLIFGAYGLHLVPSDYGGAGVVTINGVADIVTFAEAGVYLLVGDGANAWTLTPATDYSAIDGAIAAVQDAADAAQTRADDAYDLAQDAYNGLPGKLDVAGHTSLSIPASTAGTLADVAASSNDTLFGRVAGAFGFFNVTLSMIAAAVKSAAQNVESLRQIYTSTPAPIGSASAGSSVQAAAGDHVHAHGSQTDGSHHAAATTSVAGFMSATDKVNANLLNPLAAMPSYGTVKGLFDASGCTDFIAISNGIAPFNGATSGTGAGASVGSITGSPTNRVGIASLTTGTDTTGRAAIAGSFSGGITFTGGSWAYRCDLNIPTAADVTDTFSGVAGFVDMLTPLPSYGAYFRYQYTENSGDWTCVTVSGGVETTTTTGVAAVHATSYRALEILVNAAGTSVQFWVDGVLKATHTTNIPGVWGIGPAVGIRKSAGTTARTLLVDLMGMLFTATSGR